MKTKLLLSTVVLASIGVNLLGMSAQAADFTEATKGTSEVKASVILGEDGGPDIPGIPGEPEPPDPDNPNPNGGPLSIRGLSNIIFSEIEVSTVGVTVYAEKKKHAEYDFENRITVQDFRNDNERDGWELRVTMDSEFIPGSQMKMTPYIHNSDIDKLALELPNAELVVNNEAKVFARTIDTNNPSGILTMLFANPDTEGVELYVPMNTPTGDYETSLTWELVSEPEVELPESGA